MIISKKKVMNNTNGSQIEHTYRLVYACFSFILTIYMYTDRNNDMIMERSKMSETLSIIVKTKSKTHC